MKSLTEAQLKDLLKKAWEDGGWTYCSYYDSPEKPSQATIKEREEFFQKLIDEV